MLFFSPTAHCWFRICLSAIKIPNPFLMLSIELLLLLFSRSVVSDSLQSHRLHYARVPWSSPSPRACSNSCLLSQWCHPTISSSVVPFSCLQSFPVSGSFLMSWLFTTDGQSTGASASPSVLPMNVTSLQSMGLAKVFSNPTVQKHQFFSVWPSLWSNSHIPIRLLEILYLWLEGPLLAKYCLCFLIH